MNFTSLEHTVSPDIFTASPEYDKRFSGEVGDYFLAVQWNAVKEQLNRLAPGPVSILEVGGGHLQITKQLVNLGYKVTIHGSSDTAFTKLDGSELANKVNRLVSPINELAKIEERYDVIIALRLVPHVVNEKDLIVAFTRLARLGIIFDFASTQGLNSLSKFTFALKRGIEKNTRPYFNHSQATLKKILAQSSCSEIQFNGQFVFPMGAHRALKNVKISKLLEAAASPFQNFWGNPVICGAKKYG